MPPRSSAGIAHEDRNPAGNTHYETLFQTARALNLGQEALDQLYRRMVQLLFVVVDTDGEWTAGLLRP